MSKVYVLYTIHKLEGHKTIEGVTSNEWSADRYLYLEDEILNYNYKEMELDDPELLNRIAKESENKS